jgi:opacity protein-like surface antigen
MTVRILTIFALVLSVPALASAQSVEVLATTGVVHLWDDEGSIGIGVPIGGGVGLKWPSGWGIEALADTQKATRDFDSGVRFDSTVAAARARLIRYFRSGRTQPYAGAGFGVTHVESTRESPVGCALVNNVFTCTGRDISQSESTAGTWSGFAGLRIVAGGVVFLRPEFEFSMAGEHVRMGGVVAIGASW